MTDHFLCIINAYEKNIGVAATTAHIEDKFAPVPCQIWVMDLMISLSNIAKNNPATATKNPVPMTATRTISAVPRPIPLLTRCSDCLDSLALRTLPPWSDCPVSVF